jgi:hypothetical protein
MLNILTCKRICQKKLKITLKDRNWKLKKSENQKNYRLIKLLFGTVPFIPCIMASSRSSSNKFNFFSKCLFWVNPYVLSKFAWIKNKVHLNS